MCPEFVRSSLLFYWSESQTGWVFWWLKVANKNIEYTGAYATLTLWLYELKYTFLLDHVDCHFASGHAPYVILYAGAQITKNIGGVQHRLGTENLIKGHKVRAQFMCLSYNSFHSIHFRLTIVGTLTQWRRGCIGQGEIGKGDLVHLNNQYWHGVDLRKCMRAQGEFVKLIIDDWGRGGNFADLVVTTRSQKDLQSCWVWSSNLDTRDKSSAIWRFETEATIISMVLNTCRWKINIRMCVSVQVL